MSKPIVHFQDWGLVRYQKAWDRQEQVLSEGVKIKTDNRKFPDQPQLVPNNTVIFCEHPHVYTLGKSGSMENLLLNEAELQSKGIDFFKINRGGDITYHGPGQIVGYPIIDLEQFKPDLHEYLRNMEEACIRTVAEYGIASGRIAGLTGVWLDVNGPNPRKIMAIGVRCSRWITMHGFAFNVNTDLSLFENIIPCGIDDKGVTSLAAELGYALEMEDVKSKMKANMADIYGFVWAN